mmetsp:Transcript_3137/g.9144  ORF Transcript_3137/g.9144 Transcript_3137/m.9144 type:complete len:227 (+) Transcript_3137:775-1455(+)
MEAPFLQENKSMNTSPTAGCTAIKHNKRLTAPNAKTPSAVSETARMAPDDSAARTSAMMGHFGDLVKAANATVVRTVLKSTILGLPTPLRIKMLRADAALTRVSSSQSDGEPLRIRMLGENSLLSKCLAITKRNSILSSSASITKFGLMPSRYALFTSSSMMNKLFSDQPRSKVWLLATIRPRFWCQRSRTCFTTSTIKPNINKLYRKPKMLKVTATSFARALSLA